MFVLSSLPAGAIGSGQNGKMVFTGSFGSGADLYRLDAPGGTPVTFPSGASDNIFEPMYSRDGTKIVYMKDYVDHGELWVINADGTGNHKILGGPVGEYIDCPDWSPDGTKLIFQYANTSMSFFQAATLRLDGAGGVQVLTNHPTAVNCPTFAPSGQKIAFYARPGSGQDFDIYTMNADGSNLQAITSNSVDDQHPMFSPDGTLIAFDRVVGSTFDIYKMNPDGTGEIALATDTTDSEYWPNFSPDGQGILYVRVLGANAQVMSMTYAGSAKTPLFVTMPEVRRPSWQPLNRQPETAQSVKTLILNGTSATINIASTYTDAYGSVNPASLVINQPPQHGTVTTDGTTGTITYRPNVSAGRGHGFLDNLVAWIAPSATAAQNDSFGYAICSSASSLVCSSGVVNVVLGVSLANTGSNQGGWLAGAIILIMTGAGVMGARKFRFSS